MPSRDGPSAELPAIRIERTPANDVYLMTHLLLPPRQLERALADPVAFVYRHLPELDMAARLVRGQIRSGGSGHDEPAVGAQGTSDAQRPEERRIRSLLR
jgi:hypothetical protein